MRFLFVNLLFWQCLCPLISQTSNIPSPIIFIYDASGSMWGKIGNETKKEIAQNVLSQTVSTLQADQPVGLVAYGHRSKEDCEDVEFLVDPPQANKSSISTLLSKIQPLGKTPLAFSASQVISKLKTSNQKATIILVTDGIESCNGDLCKVVREAKAAGIIFKLHIVGFGLKPEETEALKCAADAGEGQYFDAANADGLSEVLATATTTTVDDPPDNFSIKAFRNGQPIDALIRVFPKGTKTMVTSDRTYRDTAFMFLSPKIYDMEVQPLENSDIKSQMMYGVQTFQDSMIFREISFDAGKLDVMTLNNEEGWDAVVNIYDQQDKLAGGGRTYGEVESTELSPGIFDVVVKAMIIEGSEKEYRYEDVVVNANETTTITHTFKSGIAMIGIKTGNILVDATVTIKDSKTMATVAAGRTYTSDSSNPRKFTLNPGTYEVIMNTLGEYKGRSERFTIVVEQGKTTEKLIKF